MRMELTLAAAPARRRAPMRIGIAGRTKAFRIRKLDEDGFFFSQRNNEHRGEVCDFWPLLWDGRMRDHVISLLELNNKSF